MSALDAALPRRRLSAALPVGNSAHRSPSLRSVGASRRRCADGSLATLPPYALRRAGMHDGETVHGSTVRLATAGVVAYAVASPLMNLWSYLRYPEHQFRPWIVVLVLGAVPLLARLARAAAEAPFTRAQLAALAATLALTATVAVAEGPPRWIVLYVPAALVAVALPRVWSVVFLVGLLAVAVVVA